MAHKHNVYDTDKHFSIDPITRAIKNETPSKISIIQFDHDSERITFEVPKTIEGHDMSTCGRIEVHYVNIDSLSKDNQNKGLYVCEDMQISPDSEDVLIFSWLISSNATQLKGSLNFLVRFLCIGDDGAIEYAWHTAIYSGLSVSEGICNSEAVAEEYADVLMKWYEEIKSGAHDGKDGVDGHTPVRGVDYWTEEDIEIIKGYVEETLLNGSW